MKLKDVIAEGITDVVYHYTNVPRALDILRQNQFRLSTSVGTSADHNENEKPYFLSLTRSRLGAYHAKTGTWGAMFVLDGRKLGNKFSGGPVDYWQMGNDADEAEDRIYSSKPIIDNAISYIREVHVFHDTWFEKNFDDRQAVIYRKLAIICKSNGVPFYFYDNAKDWKLQNKKNAVPLSDKIMQAKHREKPSKSYRWNRDKEFGPWIELNIKNDKESLSARAKKLLYDITYHDYNNDLTRRLSADIHNNKANPESGVHTLIDIMRKLKILTPAKYVAHLKQKWGVQ
jgi:hypothetical protein